MQSTPSPRSARLLLQPAQRLRLWTLRAGFAGLLVLMGLMAADAAWSVHVLGQRAGSVRKDARERDELIDRLRTEIYQSSNTLRDYLVEADTDRAASHGRELASIRLRIKDDLDAYSRRASVTEHETFTDLAAQVRSYVDVLAVAMSWDTATRHAKGDAVLRGVVIPSRTRVVRLVDEITLLNQRDLDAAEASIDALHSGFGNRIVIMSSVLLMFSVVVAYSVMRRVGLLERESASRYIEVEQARLNLARLSALLATAHEEERRRIARELHDEVGQTLSATMLELNRLESVRTDEQLYRDLVSSVRTSLEGSVRVVRDMALLLRPSMLDDLGLTAALRWQVREIMRRSKLEVTLVADEFVDDLPDAQKTCVYRVVQEALTNCVRHAQATRARVLVRRDDDGLSLTIQDDGIGFDPGREKGLGLLGLSERVERLQGLVSVESQPGRGSIISVRLPIFRGDPVAV